MMKNTFIILITFLFITNLAYSDLFTIVDNKGNVVESTDIQHSEDVFRSIYDEKFIMKIYIVKAGDSLYKIAKENNTTVIKLRKANSMKKDERLKVGKVLNVPKTSYKIAKTKTKRTNKKLSAVLSNLDTIKPGTKTAKKSKKFTVNDIFFGDIKKKSKKEIAIQKEYDCLRREAVNLDDGQSDASTIAKAVEFRCRSYSDKYMYIVLPKKVRKNSNQKSYYIKHFRQRRGEFIRNESLTIILQNRKYSQETQLYKTDN